jgi:hypothetical protein
MANPFGDEKQITNPFGDAKQVANPFGDEKQAPQVNLLSAEGLSSIGKTIIPSVKQGLLGLKLRRQENPEEDFVNRPIVKVPGVDRQVGATPEEIEQTRQEIVGTQKEIQDATPANQSYPLKIARGATQSIAQNAPGIIAAVASRNPAPAVLSGTVQSVGQTYAENRTPNPVGDMPADVDTAKLNSSIHGAIEGSMEFLPIGGLIKDLGKETFAKTAARFLLKEEATEIPTTILQKISDRALINPDQPMRAFLEEMGSEVLDTAVTTPFAAGGTVAIASSQQKLQDSFAARKEAKKAQELGDLKNEAMADLEKSIAQATAGVPVEDAVAAETELPKFDHIPDRPLTEEEEKLAATIEKNRATGTDAVPADPAAQADIADLDSLLTDPVYKQPEDFAGEIDAQIQNDMDRGMSREVAERRARESFPNQLAPSQRPIAWSSNPEQIGLSLSQARVAPDSVVLLGGNEEQFSPAYTEALGTTIKQWADRWMPKGSRIVLNLGGLKGEAVGGYQQSQTGIHIITPREMVRSERAENATKDGVMLGRLPGTGYNTFTQQQTFGALTHEFGHALVMASFAQSMPQQYQNVISALDNGALYTEQQLAEMPAAEAAVVRDYQTLKTAVLSGRMSAEQLVEKWLGTWKLGKDLMKQQDRSLYSHAKEVLRREGKRTGDSSLSSTPLNQIPAIKLIHAMGRDNNVSEEQSNAAAEAYYLQFNEYMAEQFSRYAHANRIDQGTLLGTYFAKALQSLREFFKMLKTTKGVSGERIVKPGVSFQEWVDGLHETKAQRMAVKEKKKRAPSKRKPKEKAEKPKTTSEELVKEVISEVKAQEELSQEEAINSLEALAEDPEAKARMRELVKAAIPDEKSSHRRELIQMVNRGQLLDVAYELEELNKSQVKKDVDPSLQEALDSIGEGRQATLWQRAISFVKDKAQVLLQMQQIAHTTDDPGVYSFVRLQNELMAMKNNMLKKGTDVAKQWEDLSKRDAELVEKVLLDEWQSGGHMTLLEQDPVTKKWTHKAGIAFQQYLKERGIDGTTPEGTKLAQLILDIKNSILEHIQIIENSSIALIEMRYARNKLMVQKRSFEVRELARQWRQTPFVPQSHYGNFIVKVYGQNEEGKRDVIWLGHFESAAEQDAAIRKLQKSGVRKEDVRWSKIDDRVGPQLILPKDFIETLADTGEFTGEQLEAIGDAMVPLRKEKAFARLERDASRIAGASQDILRNYANWIEDSANFTSKLNYGWRMSRARAWTRSEMNDLKRSGDVAGAREKQRVLDTMTKTQDFIMHPMEEWFQTRSTIALTYLMYAPKTALMNATGLFQTWAAVTADYGEFRGNALMAGAMKDLVAGSLTADEHWAKNKALEDGLIDQGFGYFMSGLANAGNLARRVRPTLAGKAARAFVDLGMFPFKAVETGNRNITLMAIYRAERQRNLAQGKTIEEARETAYEAASRKTRLLQNDYASGNRPEILRGKKSLFMIFLSYPQYMLWIMSGGYERGIRQEARNRGETPRSAFGGMTMRMWLIFLAMSGAEGVPFGEAIVELLQKMWSKFGTGENVRVEGHRFLKETVGIESMYWRKVIQRGFLHDVLGTDLSGSYSLGKPLPGLGLINPHADNWKEFVGEAFEELSGPFGGVVKGGVGLGMSDNLDAKELGKNLPGAAGSIARAVSANQSGLKTSRGERILRDENGNLREPTALEVLALGTGFRLSEVAQFQELEALKRQQAEYWNGRRLGLKKSYLKAFEDRDPIVREDVNKAVAEYNAEIPHPALRLTTKELREYTRNSARSVRRLEQDRDPRRVRGLNRDIAQVLSE